MEANLFQWLAVAGTGIEGNSPHISRIELLRDLWRNDSIRGYIIKSDRSHKTILHKMANNQDKAMMLAILHLLKKYYNNKQFFKEFLDQTDEKGETALFLACQSGNWGAAEKLLKAGALYNKEIAARIKKGIATTLSKGAKQLPDELTSILKYVGTNEKEIKILQDLFANHIPEIKKTYSEIAMEELLANKEYSLYFSGSKVHININNTEPEEVYTEPKEVFVRVDRGNDGIILSIHSMHTLFLLVQWEQKLKKSIAPIINLTLLGSNQNESVKSLIFYGIAKGVNMFHILALVGDKLGLNQNKLLPSLMKEYPDLIEMSDNYDNTALHLAARSGNLYFLRLVLQHGPFNTEEKRTFLREKNMQKKTALDIAYDMEYWRSAAELIKVMDNVELMYQTDNSTQPVNAAAVVTNQNIQPYQSAPQVEPMSTTQLRTSPTVANHGIIETTPSLTSGSTSTAMHHFDGLNATTSSPLIL
jgi:ankyrin repeat protein